MIPAGGDRNFTIILKRTSFDAFRQADNFRKSQAKSNAQIRQEQAILHFLLAKKRLSNLEIKVEEKENQAVLKY